MITLDQINELIDQAVIKLTIGMSKAEILEKHDQIVTMARTIVLVAVIRETGAAVDSELLQAARAAIAA